MIGIPQANPLAEYHQFKADIDSAIQGVLERGYYILGSEVAAFEEEFRQYLGVQYALGVASGTDALLLSLRALGVGGGDEVITVAHTAVATIAAIEQCGAKPILVDIDPETFTLDPTRLEAALTPKTRVVIPVHLYGHPSDLSTILDICSRHGIFVLEDCAQAHGAMYMGRKVGAWGDIAAFSFYPTKNLGAIGDGGLIATNRSDLFERARMLREYGWSERYISKKPGFNSRLDEIQAAILRVKLKYLESNNERRCLLANKYNMLLREVVITPVERPGCKHVYHLYVIRHPERDELKIHLAANGVGTGIHYPVPIHLQPAYLHRLGEPASFPVSEKTAGEILSLPLFPQLESGQVEFVAQIILDFYHKF